MQNRDRLRLNNDTIILTILLDYGKKVQYRKRLVGYGQNESYFGNKDIPEELRISRKVFGNRKSFLLKSKLISKLQSNDKRENKYSITPLGILFLFNNNLVKLDLQLARRILEITDFHAWIRRLQKRQTDANLFRKLLAEVPTKIILQCVYEGLQNIRVDKRDMGVFVYCLENFPNTPITINEMYSIMDSKIYRVSNFKEPFIVKGLKEENDLWFYRTIGNLIYHSIHLEIYKKFKDKIPEFYKYKILRSVERNLLNWDLKISELEKTLNKQWYELPHKPIQSLARLLPEIHRLKKELKK